MKNHLCLNRKGGECKPETTPLNSVVLVLCTGWTPTDKHLMHDHTCSMVNNYKQQRAIWCSPDMTSFSQMACSALCLGNS